MAVKYSFENIWYLPSANTWNDFQIMAMKDIGVLTLENNCIIFRGNEANIIISKLSAITYGKQGRDFINNWVKIEYYDLNDNPSEAYFADGNNRGWSGIFGGTKKIYKLLLDVYLAD